MFKPLGSHGHGLCHLQHQRCSAEPRGDLRLDVAGKEVPRHQQLGAGGVTCHVDLLQKSNMGHMLSVLSHPYFVDFLCSWSFWPTKLSLVYSWYKKSGATSLGPHGFQAQRRKQCCLTRRWGPGAKWWATGSSNSWVRSWPPRSTRSSVAWRWRRSGSWERLEVKHLRDRWWPRDIHMATCGFGAFVNSPSWQSPSSTCLFWVNLGSLEFLG